MQTNKTTTSSTVSYTIMVVDDQPANLRLFERLLKGHQYRVLAFNSGALALRALQRTTPDLIVLDIKMPELDGWEVNEQLKTNPKLADIPVLFLSGLSDLEAKAKAFASCGVFVSTVASAPPSVGGFISFRLPSNVPVHS